MGFIDIKLMNKRPFQYCFNLPPPSFQGYLQLHHSPNLVFTPFYKPKCLSSQIRIYLKTAVKCSLRELNQLNGTREFIGVQKSLLYFEVSITLYIYKNDTLSFVTEAFVAIVTYNTYIYTSEMTNGHLVAPKNPCDWKSLLHFTNEHTS